MLNTTDKLLAIAKIEEAVLGCLRGGEARIRLAKMLFGNLREALKHDSEIGAHLSSATAADLLRLTTKSSTFKRAIRALVRALGTCRPDNPALTNSSDDPPGVACVRALLDGDPFLVVVRGPTAAQRGLEDDDGLLRLQAEFRPLPAADDSELVIARMPTHRETDASSKGVSSFRFPPPRQLPPAPPDLAGRDADLQELIEVFARRTTNLVLLSGLSGVGKSSLALRFAAEIESRLAAHIFVDMRGTTSSPLTPQDVMVHVIHAYLPNQPAPNTLSELTGLYYSLLKQQPALMLFDNAAGPDQLLAITPPPDSFLIVTSQRRFTLPGAHSHMVRLLESRDAVQLFTTIAPNCGEEAADEIAKLCGYHPLALRAAASVLAQTPDLTPADYAARLSRSNAYLLSLNDPSTSRTADAVLSVTFDLLPETLRELMQALAPPYSFDRAAAQALGELSPELTAITLSQLLTLNLLEYDDSTDRYRQHDLVNRFVWTHLAPEQDKIFVRRHSKYFLSLLRRLGAMAVSDDDSVAEAFTAFDHDADNIVIAWRWAFQDAERDESARPLALDYPAGAWHLLSYRLGNARMVDFLQARIELAQAIGDEAIAALSSLRLAFYRINASDAHADCEQALALAEATNDQTVYAEALQLAAFIYAWFGPEEKAIPLCLKALHLLADQSRRPRLLMDTHHTLGNAYIGVWCHDEDVDKRRLALQEFRMALEIARELGDSKMVSWMQDNVGFLAQELEK